ncbi:hypothetical protein J2S74_001637 [Evansella vedderi]|uniref:RNA polymerase subunit sigma-70 n=1 Tax=Evansella vedderi TaxID=38282 RepID=A0ABT9ZU64_9BACI|nr:hypothetical protein [Evansella vedderi]MDQ0254262.1 hypothetical protein [Evansella vedderi]
MRSSHQQARFTSPNSRLLGVNLHRFTEIEENADSYEIATEFGLSLREVKSLKKRIERN